MRDVMFLENYEDFVEGMKTFKGTSREELVWATVGLTSEAGEVAGEVEKMMRKREDLEERADKVLDEVSDVLFYCTAVLAAAGHTLEECFMHNIVKLSERHG